MDLATVLSMFVLVFTSYMVGHLSASGDLKHIKRENEKLNAELHKLTDRDPKGRFRGGK